MPITLPPVSRRRFLAGSLATGLGVLLPHNVFAVDPAVDPNRLAFLSDIHIAADPTAHDRGVVMHDHLRQVCGEVLQLDPKPASVFINGDCAYHKGEIADYQTLLRLLQPMRDHGLPLHLGMGNHDYREHLWKTIPDVESHVGPMTERQVVVVETPRANVFMLDSLDATDKTPGVLGKKQIHWLADELDARNQKPAIVMVHHQPDEGLIVRGLTDTRALLDVLIPRRHVKALFYGHTHAWENIERSGMHCVNLPAVAYVFTPGQPSAWVDVHLLENGISLELRCLDPKHPRHGQKLDLAWRA
jgi:3',5'-cyclic AMP phosphodiesterase CpdA